MSSIARPVRTIRCACGGVELEARGAPIASLVCCCDDCQEGSRQVEALPGAGPVRDAYGGTPYVLYRKDRLQAGRGAGLLKACRLVEKSATNRVVATCCNSAMSMTFDDARHWVAVYRARFQDDAPPLEMRICTKFLPKGTVVPSDVPAFPTFPLAFMVKLVVARVAMLFGR